MQNDEKKKENRGRMVTKNLEGTRNSHKKGDGTSPGLVSYGGEEPPKKKGQS